MSKVTLLAIPQVAPWMERLPDNSILTISHMRPTTLDVDDYPMHVSERIRREIRIGALLQEGSEAFGVQVDKYQRGRATADRQVYNSSMVRIESEPDTVVKIELGPEVHIPWQEEQAST